MVLEQQHRGFYIHTTSLDKRLNEVDECQTKRELLKRLFISQGNVLSAKSKRKMSRLERGFSKPHLLFFYLVFVKYLSSSASKSRTTYIEQQR